MKFSTIILSTLLAALSVSAQNSTLATTTSSVVSGTAPLTPAQSTEAACLEACPVGDNNCRSKCIPKGDQTNSIADCVSNCPKGNGTATDNANYQSCVESCISNASASTAAAASPTASGSTATGSGAATGSGSGSSPTATGASAGSSGTASSTAATTSKSSAAEAVQMGSSLIGVAGLLAALFAL